LRLNNLNCTKSTDCKCGSWLEHWKQFSAQSLPDFCAEKKCLNPPTLGAHVQKDSLRDRRWYIVPVCEEHFEKTGASLEVPEAVAVVSADVTETCGIRSR